MSKSKLHLVWWLCMVPAFGAFLMLSYEWYLHTSETRFLFYAIACLVGGVVFGGLIVNASSESQSAFEGKNAESSPLGELSNSGPHLQTKSAPVVTLAETSPSILLEPIPLLAPNALPAPESSGKNESEKLEELLLGVEEQQAQGLEPKRNIAAESASPADHAFANFVAAHIDAHIDAAVEEVASPEPERRESETVEIAEAVEVESESDSLALGLLSFEPAVSETPAEQEIQNLNSETVTNVEKAQKVVARLEAEVAKAEVVAKKLEVEVKKAEPVAKRLEESKQGPEAKTPTKPRQIIEKPYQVKQPEFKTISECIAYGEKMLSHGYFDEAIQCYEKMTKMEPKNFTGWYLRGVALRKKGKVDEALYCFNYSLGINDKNPLAQSERGECLFVKKEVEQALVAFDKSLVLDKVDPKSWMGKARCLAAMGKHKDAVACFDKVLAIQPANEEAQKEKQVSASRVGAKA